MPRKTRIVVVPTSGVQDHDREEGDPYAWIGGDRVLDSHVPIDDPRLAADLGYDPAGLHGEHRGGAGHYRGPQEPFGLRHAASEDPRHRVPDC